MPVFAFRRKVFNPTYERPALRKSFAAFAAVTGGNCANQCSGTSAFNDLEHVFMHPFQVTPAS
jgi:hypothetical protein